MLLLFRVRHRTSVPLQLARKALSALWFLNSSFIVPFIPQFPFLLSHQKRKNTPFMGAKLRGVGFESGHQRLIPRDRMCHTKMFPGYHIMIYWLWVNMRAGGPGREGRSAQEIDLGHCPFMLCAIGIIVISVRSP